MKPLPPSFYRRDTASVARDLLGCRLVRRFPGGRERSVVIVETEAYLGVADRAAHTWNGRKTPRVLPMWGPGGHAYVYFVYGMHHCLNVVTKGEGEPEAVLLRAGVPEKLWNQPGGRKGDGSSKVKIASGPAKLCRYLGITADSPGHPCRARSSFSFPLSEDSDPFPAGRSPRRRFLRRRGGALAAPLRVAVVRP